MFGAFQKLTPAAVEARKRRRSAMLLQAVGYLEVGRGTGEVRLAVRPPTAPDLAALTRWAAPLAAVNGITADLPELAGETLTPAERAGMAAAYVREKAARGPTADDLMDVFETAAGAGRIVWHAAGGVASGHRLGEILDAVAAAGPAEVLACLDLATAIPAEDGGGLDLSLTWRGLLAAEGTAPAGWGKVYRGLHERYGLLPHEIDLYTVPRIMALAVPDGKVSQDQFRELLAERRRQRGMQQ